ncbi:DNA N-6-adenine-methyltransferase [Vibrio vulnificus]|uniref:DNA N-6-adenine-methyltransferase n=1 Tax=Vibrio vulnificus TaxID=672 RepID=UPI0024DF37D8|nr:DNA N-6-adenine-methyltransferase [Vibrio vulnificus]MDK2679253.1 DNA N-6-adenine-methyltransferase [Vibrio vulnificus]MDK2688018.1 DNA N-6-adenine-methyltransferase [Vibrio vulnificus]
MNNANRINQDSGNFEYYTPKEIVDAARQCMGGIELDPASSLKANSIVQAERIFTKEDDGMAQIWVAEKLWMNHPFSRGEKACPTNRARCTKKSCQKRGYHIDHDIPSNMDWINKLLEHYHQGEIKEAICITFANTSEAWFRKLLPFPQCMPNKRIQYYLPDGTLADNVTKGSAITYLGPNLDNFAYAFRGIGTIKIEY